MRRACATLIASLMLAAGWVGPGNAVAQDNPFLPQQQAPSAPAQTTATPAPPPSNTNSGGGGLGDTGAILLGVVGGVVVLGIGIWIARDARSSAPKPAKPRVTRTEPDVERQKRLAAPGARGRARRSPARGRKPSAAERRRRKRGRAR
jgi:hypothetical protein